MDPSFLFIILMFGALYWLLFRPQQKREKARREMVRSLKAGDEVVTNAGIHGAVAEVEDAVIWLEVAPNVELKITRDAVSGRIQSSDPDDADDDDDPGDDGDGSERDGD